MASEKDTQRGGAGNFANNPERASEAGRKGGQSQQSGGKSDNQAGRSRGGSGNFADDPQRASEAGKKGGEAFHGGSGSQQGDSRK
jgi:general stress protein YciG